MRALAPTAQKAYTCAGEIAYTHDEPADLQGIVNALCVVDMGKRLGCTNGVADLKAHDYFKGFDWERLEVGEMEAPIKPNVNDINAPSASEIEAFKPPKDVQWTPEDQARFDNWDFIDTKLWQQEACARMRKKNEVGGKPGGGGCCTIA